MKQMDNGTTQKSYFYITKKVKWKYYKQLLEKFIKYAWRGKKVQSITNIKIVGTVKGKKVNIPY